MWDGLLTLLLLCLIMGTASFLAGLLPLTIALSQRQLRLITALGTGVLVGTSLIVIIPEGIETLYSAGRSGHAHAERSIAFAGQRRALDIVPSLEINWNPTYKRDSFPAPIAVAGETAPDAHEGFRSGPDDGFDAAEELAKGNSPSSDEGHNEGSSLDKQKDISDPSQAKPEPHDRDPHAYVGIALVTGFILMYLIDTLPRQRQSSNTPHRTQINLNQFSLNRSQRPDEASPTQDAFASSPSFSVSRPSSTTVGLVIHAAADGIALGASSSSTTGLNFIVFLALMIHKAPAAFGLTTVLLKQGLSKRAARAHLIIFSAAAPAGALLTWATAHLLGYGSLSDKSNSTEFATGVLLLFSAGTFLYVAMHTMQESGSGHTEQQEDGYVEVSGYEQVGMNKGSQSSGMTDSFVCVLGMLLPLLTQFGHVH